jgi:hypothetical protein
MSNLIIPGATSGGTITENGETRDIKTVMLSSEQALLMREYRKKVLMPLGLQEAVFCAECERASREDGCKSFVTDSQIGIICRCTQRLYLGQSF